MAKIRNSKGDGFLTWANGNFIDSDHMENDVVSIEETARDNVSEVDTDEKIEELFPEVDLKTGIFTFEDD
jgi:hypothetical protein